MRGLQAAEAISALWQYSARYLQGLALGGAPGRGLRKQALAFFEGQGYVNPRGGLRICGAAALSALDARYG